MAKNIACPAKSELKRLLLGQLPDADAEKLEEHLLNCPPCGSAVKTLVTEDTLLEAMRAAGNVAGAKEEDVVRGLTERVKGLLHRDETSSVKLVSQASADSASVMVGIDIAFLDPPEKPDELGRLGAYRVLKLLGAGGMGMVFLAEDSNLERPVALKVMKPDIAKNPASKQRFVREAKANAQLKHDHIVSVYQVGEERGVPFIAMEFLEGMPLDQWLQGDRRPRVAQILRMGREIALGLGAAHAKGLIHRDIKPGNIWLDKQTGRVKILDFGLARAQTGDVQITQSGAIVGTPAYMAPEQARGEKGFDHRADLFSLGCVLYRLCSGDMPFKGDTMVGVLMALALNDPPPPFEINEQIPKDLSDLVMKLLAKDPADRPADAQSVVQQIQAIEKQLKTGGKPPIAAVAPIAERPIAASRPIAADKLKRAKSRRGILIGLAAVAAVALIAAGIVFFWETPYGVVRIEILDPEIKLKIEGNEGTFTSASTLPIKIKPGKPGLTITRGPDFTFLTKEFQLNKGDSPTLKIRWLEDSKVVVVLRDKEKIAESKSAVAVTGVPPTAAAAGKAESPPRDTGEILALIEKLGGKCRQDHSLDIKPIIEVNLLSSKVSDADLQALSGLAHLQVLILGNTRITDAGLAHLKELTNLQRLDLGTTDITNAGLVQLKGLTRLQRLELYRTTIDDTGLAPLRSLSELRILGLEGTRVGDAGLSHLNGLTKLEALNLSGTKVSDAGLEHLNGLTNLREFHALGTQVTEAGKKKLQAIWTAARAAIPTTDAGFVPLFNGKDLTGWVVDGPTGGWSVVDGAIVTDTKDRKTITWLLTTRDYADFRLRFECQMDDLAQSGIAFRAVPGEQPRSTAFKSKSYGYPYHLHMTLQGPQAQNENVFPTGYVVGQGDWKVILQPIAPVKLRSAGAWNTVEVELRGQQLKVHINSELIHQRSLDELLKLGSNFAGLKRNQGRIGFEHRHGVARFRNIEISRLTPLDQPANTLEKSFTNTQGMRFALIPKGKAWFGGMSGTVGTHESEMPHDFYMGVYEVTQEQWQSVAGVNPSHFSRNGKRADAVKDFSDADLARFPVDNVSWDDCQEFITRLNEKTKESGWIYRLPNEMEWQYACRGGSLPNKEEYAFDFYLDRPTNTLLPDKANFNKHLKRPMKVGSYPPNRLGLFDMHGNMGEWCDDLVQDNKGGAARPTRGGGWGHEVGWCRTVFRVSCPQYGRFGDIGLRLARVPVSK